MKLHIKISLMSFEGKKRVILHCQKLQLLPVIYSPKFHIKYGCTLLAVGPNPSVSLGWDLVALHWFRKECVNACPSTISTNVQRSRNRTQRCFQQSPSFYRWGDWSYYVKYFGQFLSLLLRWSDWLKKKSKTRSKIFSKFKAWCDWFYFRNIIAGVF